MDIITRPIMAAILRSVLDFTAARPILTTTIIRSTDITVRIMDITTALTTTEATGITGGPTTTAGMDTTAGVTITAVTAITGDIRDTIDPIPTGTIDATLAFRNLTFHGTAAPESYGAVNRTRRCHSFRLSAWRFALILQHLITNRKYVLWL